MKNAVRKAPTWIFFMARRLHVLLFFLRRPFDKHTKTKKGFPLLRQQEWDASDFNQNRPVLYS